MKRQSIQSGNQPEYRRTRPHGLRAFSALLLAALPVCSPATWAQSLSKEYIRLGSRVVAIENYGSTGSPLTVSPGSVNMSGNTT